MRYLSSIRVKVQKKSFKSMDVCSYLLKIGMLFLWISKQQNVKILLKNVWKSFF